MESRHTLHDAATAAAQSNQSSNSYSAWRTAQQTQPRIFQYNPAASQQNAQQQTQPTSTQTQSNAPGPVSQSLPSSLDKNIIFANSAHSQTYGLPANPAQTQPAFTPLQDESSGATNAVTDPSLGQTGNTASGQSDPSKPNPPTTSGGRTLNQNKRAAQNRAAQRAFRQRKERYIKTLEEKATRYDLAEIQLGDLRKENVYLRDYVVRLQNEVDSLNSELGRAPMFATGPAQRAPQPPPGAQPSIPVHLNPNYPLQIDPQTAAAAAAAAAAASVHSQDGQSLTRLAPADATHNAITLPAGNDQPLTEAPKVEETAAPKKSRSRKRKNEPTAEAGNR